MKLLEERIIKDGRITKLGYINLTEFLNHGVEPDFLSKLGSAVKKHFAADGVTKILTAEASGIPGSLVLPLKNSKSRAFRSQKQTRNHRRRLLFGKSSVIHRGFRL